MDTKTLQALGLTHSQAKAYLVMVRHGAMTPPALAGKIHETRSNTYKILERLAELGMVRKDEAAAKRTYRVENPVVLEALAKKARNEALDQERRVQSAMPLLLNYFYTFSEQPGVRFFQGREGLKEVFADVARTRQDEYMVRPANPKDFYDREFFLNFRRKQADSGITTHIVTPRDAEALRNQKHDADYKLKRTMISKDDYTAPVEWKCYGNKVAIISYGEEAVGMIIESPQIAESFRQLYSLLASNKS